MSQSYFDYFFFIRIRNTIRSVVVTQFLNLLNINKLFKVKVYTICNIKYFKILYKKNKYKHWLGYVEFYSFSNKNKNHIYIL